MPESQTVTIYDSLQSVYPQLEGLFANFFGKLARQNQMESQYTVTYAQSPPQQDSASCGLYTISNILCLASSQPLEDLNNRLESVRRSIVYILCQSLINK